jgi:alpha-glucoside transport system substrate-binding protein
MEDIMLRTAGADVYDQWVANEIPFNDPAVKAAAETFAEIIFNDDYIAGTASNVPDLDFRDAPDGMVTPSIDEPTCLMHRQASFIVNFFPEGTEVGTDIGVFAFPAIDPAFAEAALIAGELGAVFSDAPEVVAFIEAFISEGVQCAQGGQEGVQRISPNVNTTAECYGDEVTATSAAAILDALRAGGARFDASDLMPSAVGSGSFWTGMNEWMRGADLDSVLTEIENSWP